MRDLKKYWREVNALEKEMEPFVWLVPLKGPADLVQVTAAVAAKLLHGASHRLAMEAEKAAYRESQDTERRRAFHSDLRRQGIAVVSLND